MITMTHGQTNVKNGKMFFLIFTIFGFFCLQEEFQRLYTQLEQLKEKNMRLGNRHLAARISAMQEAAKQSYNETVHEAGTPSGHVDSDHLKLNNVLAVVTDKIVCATVVRDDAGIRSITLDTTNKARSPPKSKCSSVVSSPDSESPFRDRLSPTPRRISVANLSNTMTGLGETSMETSGRTYSEDSSMTLTSDQQLRCHKGKEYEHVSDADIKVVDLEMASTCKKSSCDGGGGSRSKKRSNVSKSRNSRSSGDGRRRKKCSSEGDVERKECNRCTDRDKGETVSDGQSGLATAKATHSQSSSEGASPKNTGGNNRNLKSGHARTHAIVINLDDKNRFTEEVTV
jgi:hypothetical protein